MGEMACYGSHLKALEWILSSENEFGIVCEDDVKLYLAPRLAQMCLDNVGTNWDMLYLSEHIMPALTRVDSERGKNWVALRQAPVGTQFYAISIRLAEYILENHLIIGMPIDELYRMVSRNRNLGFRFLSLTKKAAWGRHYEKINRSLINPAAA